MCTSFHLAITGDGGVVLDLEHDRLLKLNAIGAEMWALLSRGMSEDQVIEKIARHYGVDPLRVRGDLRALVRQGAELGLSPESLAISEPATGDAVGEKLAPTLSLSATVHLPRFVDVIRAVLGLSLFDGILLCRSLESLCSVVRWWPMRHPCTNGESIVIGQTLAAVERASTWYPKKALCLQRSAVTTCLLRARGVQASMVVGVRPMPLLAHAWVEVDGRVVNDSRSVKSFYQSLTSY
jgi:hypothetical protein